MKKTIFGISVLTLLFFIPSVSWALKPIPARIGGTVTVAGVTLTDDTDNGYTIKITKQDGSSLGPGAEDTNGLSSTGWYIIDIPLYNANSQIDGVNTGDTVVIHVFKGNRELKIKSPANGEVIVGTSRSTTQIDIEVEKLMPVITPILFLLLEE